MFVEGTKSQIEKCIDMEMGKIHYITGIILSFCCLINVVCDDIKTTEIVLLL